MPTYYKIKLSFSMHLIKMIKILVWFKNQKENTKMISNWKWRVQWKEAGEWKIPLKLENLNSKLYFISSKTWEKKFRIFKTNKKSNYKFYWLFILL